MPTSEPEPTTTAASTWGVLLLATALAAGLLGWTLTRAPAPEAGRPGVSAGASYVGNRACARCHPGEAAAYGRSGHARTLAPAGVLALARELDGRSVRDPDYPEALWTFRFRNGRLGLERTEDGGGHASQVLEYAFGSGHQAVTFLSLTGGELNRPEGLEHRISYFARDRAFDITPGQRAATHATGGSPLGRRFTADETRKCFDCHATRVSDRGPAVLDPATLIPNVTCERCHGPGRAHVEAADRGKLDLPMRFGPDRWSADDQMKLCGACHRLPSFVPADQLDPENPVLRRFQTVGLMQSKCYTRSRGALSCVTCHDPHARTATDRAGYEAACLKCHRAPPQTTCPVSKTDSCLDCHMPRRESGARLSFADHWIRTPTEPAPGSH